MQGRFGNDYGRGGRGSGEAAVPLPEPRMDNLSEVREEDRLRQVHAANLHLHLFGVITVFTFIGFVLFSSRESVIREDFKLVPPRVYAVRSGKVRYSCGHVPLPFSWCFYMLCFDGDELVGERPKHFPAFYTSFLFRVEFWISSESFRLLLGVFLLTVRDLVQDLVPRSCGRGKLGI